jgi:hypothetical protein
METHLAELGLPRGCWRELWIAHVFGSDEPDPRRLDIAWPHPPQPVALRDFVTRERQKDASTAEAEAAGRRMADALWTAAVAWAADLALTTRDPEFRFRAGRYMGAFEALRAYPDNAAETMRRVLHDVRARGGKAAARKRHDVHVEENVKAYREEFLHRLAAGEKRIIARMAARDGKTERNLRDMIKPREREKEVRERQATMHVDA